MSVTLHGQLLDRQGFARRVDSRGRTTQVWATPPSELRKRQPRGRVNFDHEFHKPIGKILDLERAESGVWAVVEVDGAPPALFARGDLYFSAETLGKRDGLDQRDVELTGIAVVRRTASVCVGAIDIYPGSLASRGSWHVSPQVRARLDRAADQRYKTGDLVIKDPPAKLERMADGGWLADGEPVGRGSVRGGMHIRPGGRILSVR